MMKLNALPNLRLAAAVAVSVACFMPAAQANLVFNGSSSANGHVNSDSSSFIEQIADCLGIDVSQLGSTHYSAGVITPQNSDGSASIFFQLGARSCSLKFDGDFGAGTCIIVQDSHNNSYIWDLSKCWNGSDEIDLDNICSKGSHITSIQFYGFQTPNDQTTSVPEPGTLAAGALLLAPLGIQAFRRMRKHQPTA
jgi:hypothetical protein